MPMLKAMEDGKEGLAVNSPNDCMTFSIPEGSNFALVQLAMLSAASLPAATVTCEISVNGRDYVNFPSGAVTYAAVGIQTLLSITGVRFIRLRVSTAAGSGGEILGVFLSVGRDT